MGAHPKRLDVDLGHRRLSLDDESTAARSVDGQSRIPAQRLVAVGLDAGANLGKSRNADRPAGSYLDEPRWADGAAARTEHEQQAAAEARPGLQRPAEPASPDHSPARGVDGGHDRVARATAARGHDHGEHPPWTDPSRRLLRSPAGDGNVAQGASGAQVDEPKPGAPRRGTDHEARSVRREAPGQRLAGHPDTEPGPWTQGAPVDANQNERALPGDPVQGRLRVAARHLDSRITRLRSHHCQDDEDKSSGRYPAWHASSTPNRRREVPGAANLNAERPWVSTASRFSRGSSTLRVG